MASRPHVFTREQLTSMKRVDIQRICKDYGVRANMKTDALIDLLLDSINSNMSPLIGRAPPKPQYHPPPRRVSTRSSSRVSSLRSRGPSGSSTSNSVNGSGGYGTSNSARINKSKATQHRLGVGRPSAAGGSGTRKPTRSGGVSGVRRGASRSVHTAKPPQLTIAEEPDASEIGNAGNPYPNTDGNSTSYLAVPGTSSVSPGNDIVNRLASLEAMFREVDPEHQDPIHDIPSQLNWLRVSAERRDTEILSLRGELNLCKAEILNLKGEVSRIGYLEGQLRSLQDFLDQVGIPSTSTPKGKTPRRVSVPLGDSNTNTPPFSRPTTLPPVPEEPSSGSMQSEHAPLGPAVNLTALGKRPLENQGDVNPKDIHAENDRGKRSRPERKRARNGEDRLVLREKEIPRKPGPEEFHQEEAGESAGTSTSGPSSQPPSIGTPPPVSDAFLDDQALLDICQGNTGMTRNEMFPPYLQPDEPFSPGSALKARNLMRNPSDSGPINQRINALQTDFEPRRISTAAARPRTPTRALGHDRFRIAVDANAAATERDGIRQQHQQPFGFGEGVYGYQHFDFNHPNPTQADFNQRDIGHNGQGELSPPAMPLAVGYGLAAHTLADESPIRGPATTMYGTEIQNDTRFGDFGRDGIASGSTMNFWGAF